MDRNEGRLDMLKDDEAKELLGGRNPKTVDHFFHEGERLMIKGSLFRVQNVNPKGLRLKVLKRPDEVSDA